MTVTRPSDKPGDSAKPWQAGQRLHVAALSDDRELSAGSCGGDGGGRCAVRVVTAGSMYGANVEIGSLSDAATIAIIEFMGIVTGPIRRGDGIAVAVVVINPQVPHNLGAAVRGASGCGVRRVWSSGDRVRLDGAKRQRLPREERMRGYNEVEVRQGGPVLRRVRGRGPGGRRAAADRRMADRLRCTSGGSKSGPASVRLCSKEATSVPKTAGSAVKDQAKSR